MVNIQKILPVKNMELKHLKKEKKMKNLYMANIDKYMQKKLCCKIDIINSAVFKMLFNGI